MGLGGMGRGKRELAHIVTDAKEWRFVLMLKWNFDPAGAGD
jgi:hypothetical protein